MKKFMVITAGVFILYGCASKLYVPGEANVQKAQSVSPGITLGQMTAARKLYAAKCSSCHNLHLPKELSALQWQKNLDKMQVRAKITDAQKQLLFTYLTAE